MTGRGQDGRVEERHEREVLDEATRGRMARFTVYELVMGAPGAPADPLELAVSALTDLGMLLERRPASVSGLLGAGRGGRTPVVVTVRVNDGTYHVRAVWKATLGDGRLRRGRAGLDALERIAGRLRR